MTRYVEFQEGRTATVAVLFCDLVSSTARGELLGDDEADRFRRTFFARLDEAVTATHGELVKNTGDGIMAVFRDSTVSAVTCAATLHDKVEALDCEPPAFVRIGISAGEVADEHGDYFGTPVVEASRLCDKAEAGQTLVTDVVRVLVGSRGGHAFRSVGSLNLKGLAAPVATATLVRTAVRALKPPRQPARGRARWPFAAAALVVLLSVLGAALVVVRRHDDPPSVVPAAAAGYAPRVQPAKCEREIRALSKYVQCGMLAVPEDRAKPKGRWIQIEYRRYPASADHSSTRTLVDVGDPALPTPTTGGEDLDKSGISPSVAANAGADLVVLASRGLYRSTPTLDCPEFDAVGPDVVAHAQDDPVVVARGQAALRACYQRLVHSGVDPAHYRITDQADDVVDLIHALALRSVDLSAGNDGALVAFDVAEKVPGAVRSMVLVNPAAPMATQRADPTASLAAVFQRYIDLCKADTKCHRAYPDLGGAYRDRQAAYEAQPRLARPEGGLVIPGLRLDLPVRLDGGHIAQGLASVFEGDPTGLALLPAGIALSSDGLYAALVASEQYPLLLPHFPWGAYLSRICNDRAMGGAMTYAATRRGFPEFAGFDDPTLWWMCKAWPVPATTDDFTMPDISAPTFIARQELSPRQAENAVDVIRAAAPSVRVYHLGAPTSLGIMGVFPHCFNDLVRAFERDPNGALDIKGCEQRESKIDFVTPPG